MVVVRIIIAGMINSKGFKSTNGNKIMNVKIMMVIIIHAISLLSNSIGIV